MKEIVLEKLVRVTEILTVHDDVAEGVANLAKSDDNQREWAAEVKRELGLDDVQVKDVKTFVRDISPKKSRKRES